MSKYKAIFLDIDRTIIATAGSLPSAKLRQSITKVKKSGRYVCLATARQFSKTRHIASFLGLDDPCVVSGGAQIVSAKNGEFIKEYPIDRQKLGKILALLKDFKESIWIQDNEIEYDLNKKYQPDKPMVIGIDKVDSETADLIIHKVSEVAGIIAFRTSRYDSNQLVDINITMANATKQHGILKILELLNLKSDNIIGVGDSYNDFPLLMASGLKVAMADAVPELKEIADFVCPTVEEDGVVEVIEKFLLNQ